METYLIEQGAFQLTQSDLLIRAGVATGIGAIIGLEREYAGIREPPHGFAGIRTFILITLFGFLATLSYYLLSPAVYISALAAVILITGISYYITASKGEIGATTEFSVLISFFLGTFACLGLIEISLMITVLTVVLLSAKFRLQAIVGQISAEELYDFIRFVVIGLLIFPFLPDEGYGPGDVLNPREIGWVVLLTSGLGFAGYLLLKFLGPHRGILLGGLVGGLISSTAVTWVYAKRSREHAEWSINCAIAILAASSIMILRVMVWTYVFNHTLFKTLLLPCALLLTAGLGTTLFLFLRKRREDTIDAVIRSGKPLDLHGALLFGLIYTLILLAVYWANELMGDRGLLLTSTMAGLTDIDAITISLSKMAGRNLLTEFAARAVLVATLANTLVKLGIGLWAGSPALRPFLIAGYGLIFLTGILSLFLIGN